MNRSLWTRCISKTYCPGWQCPICQEGTISLMPKSLTYEETFNSSNSHDHDQFDPDWIQYLFTALGQCSQASCQQKFAIAGEGGVSPEYGPNGRDWQYEDYFMPKYCFPMPHIIDLPQNCPDEIKEEMIKAFSLFWINRSACAGRIRVLLEMLMNQAGVSKEKKLNDRIIEFTSNNPETGMQLMALKWLGNTGSHEDDVSKADILDAFEILEHALIEIIDNRKEKIAELAAKLQEKHQPKKTLPLLSSE